MTLRFEGQGHSINARCQGLCQCIIQGQAKIGLFLINGDQTA